MKFELTKEQREEYTQIANEKGLDTEGFTDAHLYNSVQAIINNDTKESSAVILDSIGQPIITADVNGITRGNFRLSNNAPTKIEMLTETLLENNFVEIETEEEGYKMVNVEDVINIQSDKIQLRLVNTITRTVTNPAYLKEVDKFNKENALNKHKTLVTKTPKTIEEYAGQEAIIKTFTLVK